MADRAIRVGIGAALHEQRRGLQVTVSEAGEYCPGQPEGVVRSQVTDEIGADQIVADRSLKGEQCETCALDRAGSEHHDAPWRQRDCALISVNNGDLTGTLRK
jgi:hypothetical protein